MGIAEIQGEKIGSGIILAKQITLKYVFQLKIHFETE